jgi:hypothetical protein
MVTRLPGGIANLKGVVERHCCSRLRANEDDTDGRETSPKL